MINCKLVVFESNPDFSDNSRALYDYLVAHTDYKCFWVIKDEAFCQELAASGVACGLAGTKEAEEKIGQARFLVSSSFYFAYHKKRDQIHISLWHGFGTKVVGFFDSAATNEAEFETLRVMTRQCDMMSATSRSCQIALSGMFAIDPRKVHITGFPRNDYLFTEDGRRNLEMLLGRRLDGKLIFYLPTMRKGLKDEGLQFEDNLFNYPDFDAAELNTFLEENDAYIITKPHFADIDLLDLDASDVTNRIIAIDTDELLSRRLTIYHVLNAFDCLVTDYSSVYSDYLLLDRPMVFSCPDFDLYGADRGFIADDPRFMMPGPFVKTQAGLLQELGEILSGIDKTAGYRHFMMPFFHSHDDGDSSSRVYEVMLAIDQHGQPDCDKDYGFAPDEAVSGTDRCTAQFYFDMGDGFIEESSEFVKYNVSKKDVDGFVSLAIEVPPGARNSIRFDPSLTNDVMISDFSASFDGKPALRFHTNGVECEGMIIFPEDPQIHIEFEIPASLSTTNHDLVVRFKAEHFSSEGPMLLYSLAKGSDELSKSQSRKGRFLFWNILGR